MGEILKAITGRIPGESGGTMVNEPESPISKEMAAIRLEKTKNQLTNEFLRDGNPITKEEPASAMTSLAAMATAREKSNSETINTLLSKLFDMQAKTPTLANDPAFVTLQNEIKELKNSQQNPFEVWNQVQTSLGQFAASMGLTKPAPQEKTSTIVQDASVMIQLKQMEITHATQMKQWEIEMEERRHQWDVDTQLRSEEIKLKRMEILDKKESSEKRGDLFTDILGAFSQNVTIARGDAPITIGNQPASTEPGFPCDDCHRFIKVTDPNAATATCAGCGLLYNLGKKTETQKP